jgi:hypothetical protein
MILESVDLLEPDNGNIRLVNIFGEQKILPPGSSNYRWSIIK